MRNKKIFNVIAVIFLTIVAITTIIHIKRANYCYRSQLSKNIEQFIYRMR